MICFLQQKCEIEQPSYGLNYFAFNATDGVNSGCVWNRTISGDVGQCFFAEHTAPFIKTPIFALQTD